LRELLTFLTTTENSNITAEDERKRTAEFNQLVENLGFEASLEDDDGREEDATPFTPSQAPSPQFVSEEHASHSVANRKSSMCTALEELKGNEVLSPSAIYDRANCAEIKGQTSEAIQLLQKYLATAPQALDADSVRARISELESLVALPERKGSQVRRLYSQAYGYLGERKYDRGLTAFSKAQEIAPEFPLTYWKLGLFYEALANVDETREQDTRYQQLTPDDRARKEADLHLTTPEAKKSKYDGKVSNAEDILADLLNRGMNLTFNLDNNRSAIRVRRARIKNKKQQKDWKRVGGFAVPYPYAQQQLARAGEHLQTAWALFPLGAEANELMGLVFLQANDGRAAIRNFDAVASQQLPVAFYAALRGAPPRKCNP
jgi:hypothetical protein